MPDQTRVVGPGPGERTVRTEQGQVLPVPAGWVLVPPGDPAVSRRIKAAGPSWTVQERKGRKLFGRGVWVPAGTVEAVRAAVEAERAKPAYAAKRAADGRRREAKQVAYVQSFDEAVRAYLAFHPRYASVAERMAAAVTAHATPVGSGTVARTERIPVEQRAEAAVIAWMRHQTTAYDHMSIARIKGERREVRRRLAQQSKAVLAKYRAGSDADPACPLRRALTP